MAAESSGRSPYAMSELVKTARAGRCLPSPSRSSSRACVPWGVSCFLSGRLVACPYRSCSSRKASRFSSRSIVSSRIACSFRSSHLRLPVGLLVLSPCSRPSVSSYRLAVASCLLVSFFLFIHLIVSVVLRICDEAFLRGGAACYPYHPDGRASRSMRLVCSLPIRSDGVGGIRARHASSGHEATRGRQDMGRTER